MKSKLILAVLIISALACKKSVIKSGQPVISRTFAAVTNNSPANITNPYDSVGLWHNLILTDVLNNIDLKQPADTAKITPAIISFVKDKMRITLPLSYFNTVQATVADEPNGFQNILNKTSYSAHLKNLLENLIRVVNTVALSNKSYSAVKDTIEAFEQSTINDPMLLPGEKKTALIAASVARYSYFYWSYENPTASSLKARNIVKWIAAVTSDIGGALISDSTAYAADCSSYAYWLVTYSMP